MHLGLMTTLREGFTTGSAAAAAAHAAVRLLCGRPLAEKVDVPRPPVPVVAGRPSAAGLARLEIPVAPFPSPLPGFAAACVIKDGGDDPDATHGVRIIAAAGRLPPPGGASLILRASEREMFLYAGEGIGRATLPGLPIAVGEPAINPEPRKQIALAVEEAAQSCGYAGPLHIVLSVPEGRKRAQNTLNPRLGIVGGISILGTQGTVRPFSHAAWQATIEQGLSVARAVGLSTVMFSTGRRSERLLFEQYPGLPTAAGIQAADFAAFSMRLAGSMGFERLVWGCFPGKLLKLAQGLEYTHAKTAPADLERIFAFLRSVDADLEREVRVMPTAAGVFGLLDEHRPDLMRDIALSLGREALRHLRAWAGSGPALRLVMFTASEKPLPALDDPPDGW